MKPINTKTIYAPEIQEEEFLPEFSAEIAFIYILIDRILATGMEGRRFFLQGGGEKKIYEKFLWIKTSSFV